MKGKQMKWIMTLLLGIVLATSAGCGDYYDGYAAGQKEAMEAKGEMGGFGAALVGTAMELGAGKIDENKSKEWNAGWREGFGKEIGTR